MTQLVAAGAADPVARLAASASTKRQEKAVKRAVYLLGQRGVQVSVAPRAAAPAPGAQLKSAALPVLMAPPDRDDARLFTLAKRSGKALELLEVLFETPVGLQRLQSSPSSRGAYLPWARGMTARRGGGLPERVQVDPGLLTRKLWEISNHVRGDRMGDEVDAQLARTLALAGAEPPHPVTSMPLPGARTLSIAQLGERPYRLAPFLHTEPQRMLRQTWKASGGGSLHVDGHSTALADAVNDWADQWGYPNIRETLLDTAAFCAGNEDPDGAHTLREVAMAPDLRSAIREFLVRCILWSFR